MSEETVNVQIVDGVATITMTRPERRNAFNSQMVRDLSGAFGRLLDHECRSIVLTGEGAAFSAGADLEYMREIRHAGHEANVADALALANLLAMIYSFPKPVVAKVNGPAIGGGLGLVAACDIAVAKQGVFFAFSEVRLGLVPAVIAPYLVKAMGEKNARRYMLTGDRFHAEKAQEMGLIDRVVVQGDLENSVRGLLASFKLAAPGALASCKELIHRVNETPLEDVKGWTAELIARLRAGEEGQAGMGAFLEKSDPPWQQEV